MPGSDQVTRPVTRRIAVARPAAVTSMRYRESLHALNGHRATNRAAPAYSRFVNQWLGRQLAATSYQAGLTPNAVTALSVLWTSVAIALLTVLSPSITLAIVVTSGLVLGHALGSADGQLARLDGGGTRSGKWLDRMVDAVKISSLHLAVLVFLYRTAELPGEAWLLVPIGFTMVAAVSFFGTILTDQLRRMGGPDSPADPGRSASTTCSMLLIPTDYGVLCLTFMLLGWPAAFLTAYTVLFAGSSGYLLYASVKWFRDLRALDRRPAADR